MNDEFTGILNCPVPIMNHKTIQLGHGSGGKMSHDLLQRLFMPRFKNDILDALGDQAKLGINEVRLAFSTDSFVVDPIFFPGGNIGDLAINGTVNDLAVGGAIPKFLSVGFILEEGFPMDDLHKILVSMEVAAKKAGIQVVTGDTKVVNKGSVDKIFINTSGIGAIPMGHEFSPKNIQIGDKVLVSGTIGDHGMTILSTREGLALENPIQSDSAALNGLIAQMLEVAPTGVRVMRDPTRGGVATTLNEFAQSSMRRIRLDQAALPVKPEVESACEILGLDPLYVANEGKLIAIVSPEKADKILLAMQQHEFGEEAAMIGEVTEGDDGRVTVLTGLGAETIIDMLPGEQLPRIC